MNSAKHVWSVSEGTYQGSPIVVRRNDSAPLLCRPDAWAIRVGVAVPLNAPNERGLPEVVENAQLAHVEEHIVAAAGQRAILVLVISTSGMREFVLYSQTGAWIAAFHQSLLAAVGTHEVQCMAEEDPAWDLYQSFADCRNRP